MKGKFSELDLRVLNDDEMFKLLNPLTYRVGHFSYTVPQGYVTDLATIPRPLRSIFKKTGKSRKASVVHDHMITSKWKSRKEADRMFRQMLIDLGMDPWKAYVYYIGVCIGTMIYGDYV